MMKLPPRLKLLVDLSVTELGHLIRAETGEAGFRRVEKLRHKMAGLRSTRPEKAYAVLRKELAGVEGASAAWRLVCARSFTLMLELMNACENAYRNHSIRQKPVELPESRPDAVIYVLTAHPTEARSPENIWIFHALQQRLTDFFDEEGDQFSPEMAADIRHLLQLAWKASVVRRKKPRVHDEAEHIFSTLLREETLRTLLQSSAPLAPIYIRSWVGGDKDGHPGVNQRTARDSLQLSRKSLLHFAEARLRETQRALEAAGRRPALRKSSAAVFGALAKVRRLAPGDGKRILHFREALRTYGETYERAVGAIHPALRELKQLVRIFPALVAPLEFRESSDLLPEAKRNPRAPIARMLALLAALSRGAEPRWYVRGMIVSMTENVEHMRLAAALVKRALGDLRIPVIPLFEQAEALDAAPEIVSAMLRDPLLRRARKKFWGNYLEVMVGYSDSSKQSGVLPSRLKIAQNMHSLDRLCQQKGVTPLFFQGSGGSVDRGGGSVEEQTAWWPAGALRNYKVTIQGEMVERSMASPEITRRQLERIVASAGRWRDHAKRRYRPQPGVEPFADQVARTYREKVAQPEFLRVIEQATPYLFLDRLRIGSRPTKRATTLSVGSLRAIPWVLCWTQTRVLFPTWWGVGTAWRQSSLAERRRLARAFGRDPVFTVFVRALSYTVEKVELPVWRIYLERSGLTEAQIAQAWADLSAELSAVESMLRFLPASRATNPRRAWLMESIRLRSPMIHPLNLLQLVALRKNEPDLLRTTVTGIANGMVATG